MHRPELLKYHPNYFAASRDFFPALYSSYQNFRLLDGVPPKDGVEELFGRLVNGYWNPRLLDIPIDQRPRKNKRLFSELSLFCHVARFFHQGRNLFHFSAALTRLLKMTDVDDVRWASIMFPHASFYIWFGPQREWKLRDGDHWVDGAYVGEIPPSLDKGFEVLLTTRSQAHGDSCP